MIHVQLHWVVPRSQKAAVLWKSQSLFCLIVQVLALAIWCPEVKDEVMEVEERTAAKAERSVRAEADADAREGLEGG